MGPKRTIPASQLKETQSTSSQQQPVQQVENEDDQMLEINEVNFASNQNQLKYIRNYGAVNAGMLAGILGVSGLGGIVVYISLFFIISFALYWKTEFNVTKYFFKTEDVMYGGLTNDILIFIMMWVIAHNLTNIL